MMFKNIMPPAPHDTCTHVCPGSLWITLALAAAVFKVKCLCCAVDRDLTFPGCILVLYLTVLACSCRETQICISNTSNLVFIKCYHIYCHIPMTRFIQVSKHMAY